jgi:rhodanese-related sulfurtransferase
MKKKRSVQGMLVFSILLSFIFSFSLFGVKQAVTLVRAEVVLDGKITDKEYPQSKTFDKGNFELHWQVLGENVFIAMKAKTNGWVSLGISPTEMMKDADMIITWVEKNGETKLFDAFSTGEMGPHPPDEKLGGTNDISTFAGTEFGEYTTIEFQRKLDTGDKYDRSFPRSGNLKIIVAYGSRDDFAAMHVFRATDTISIDEVKEEKKYKEITVQEAKKMYDNDPSLMILDVSSAWKNGHLPGAVNVEYNKVASNLNMFNKERAILVYCHGDAPAIFAADVLGKNGFPKVFRLLGNYGAWLNSGYPIEKYKEQTQVKFQINNDTYWLDNVAKQMDTKAMIIEGRTMLPIRYLAEALGAKVGWNAGIQEVAIYLQFIEIKLQIGKADALINGKKIAIDASNDKVKPVIVPPGRTLLPLRFVAESLQCQVDWNPSLQEVLISYKP